MVVVGLGSSLLPLPFVSSTITIIMIRRRAANTHPMTIFIFMFSHHIFFFNLLEVDANWIEDCCKLSARASKVSIIYLLNSRINLILSKVRIFWEDHKIWKNLPLKIWCYWVVSNFKRKIFSNFVAFSEYPNFKIDPNLSSRICV